MAKKKASSKKKAVNKKTAAKKATAKKTVSKKAAASKASVKKSTAKKAAAKKATTKKAGAKKATAKKATTKKTTAKKAVAKKAVAKKTAGKKATSKKPTAGTQKKAATKKAASKKASGRPQSSSRKSNTKAEPNSMNLASQSVSQVVDFQPYNSNKGEEYMSEDMKNHFRGILYQWRSELMMEVDRTMGHMKDDASNFADPSDRATQEEEFALELRTRDRERKLIRKINKTLDRIDDDDYGWCDQCGIEIGIRRLEARPTADLCIDCKTLDEIREKQTRL
ncbi:MAG: RNA polymerase-binding protein DksA [Pseudomonadota bacterium]